MGSNTLAAINGLITLTELSQKLAVEIGEVSETIREAQAEGRDLNASELEAIELRRQQAVAAWNERSA